MRAQTRIRRAGLGDPAAVGIGRNLVEVDAVAEIASVAAVVADRGLRCRSRRFTRRFRSWTIRWQRELLAYSTAATAGQERFAEYAHGKDIAGGQWTMELV